MQILPLDIRQMKKIYRAHMRRDFPKHELRPFRSIRSLHRRGFYEALGLYDGGELVAYATLVKTDGVALLDYYAVLPEKRDGGIGGRFLKQLAEGCGADGLLIEVESPRAAKNAEELEICSRRIAFYERNGARLTGVSGVVFTADFTVMYIPLRRDMDAEETLRAIMTVYGKIAQPRFLPRIGYKID